MSKIEEVRAAMVAAMKAKDKDTKETLSILLGALKNKAIDKRADLTEEEEIQVILKEIKQTKETLEMTPADRTDIIEEFTDLYLRLMNTPCVGCIYRTPSGKGLKALIVHDNADLNMHGNLYRQLMQMFQTPYIGTDPKCQDLNRRNYLCYDPNVWVNPKPIPFHFVYDSALDTIKSNNNHTTNKGKQIMTQRIKPIISLGLPSDASVMSMLKSRCKRFHSDYLIEGARRDGVYWFGTQASKAGVDYLKGLEYVKKLYQSNEVTLTRGGIFTEDEIIENYTNGYDAENYDENYRKTFIIHR